MTRAEENKARDKVWRQLKSEGYERVTTNVWRKDGETFDLDAAVMVDGRLRSAWAVKWEAMNQ